MKDEDLQLGVEGREVERNTRVLEATQHVPIQRIKGALTQLSFLSTSHFNTPGSLIFFFNDIKLWFTFQETILTVQKNRL